MKDLSEEISVLAVLLVVLPRHKQNRHSVLCKSTFLYFFVSVGYENEKVESNVRLIVSIFILNVVYYHVKEG